MKILFAVPPYNMNGFQIPYGISIVATVAKQAGFDVQMLVVKPGENILDYNTRLLNKIKAEKIGLVALGGMSPNYPQLKRLISNIRDEGVLTVLGGNIVDAQPELITQNIGADFCVIGEAEQTFVELAKALTKPDKNLLDTIAGLSFMRDGKLVITPTREPIEDLDSLPFIDTELCEWDQYFENDTTLFLMLSRSCPFQCTFCYHLKGSRYRQKSLDYTFQELDYYLSLYGDKVKTLYMMDDLFNIDKKRVIDFCQRISKYNIPFIASTRMESMDEDMLIALKNAGCYMVSYGLESASNKILRSMKKHLTVQKIEEVLALTKKHGMKIQANLIIGDVEDDEETIAQSERFYWKHCLDWDINIMLIRVFPGTELYKYAIEQEIIKNELEFLENGVPLINVSKLSDDAYLMLSEKYISYQTAKDRITRRPITTQNSEFRVHREGKVDYVVHCPLCGTKREYINYDLKSRAGRIIGDRYSGCLRCKQRLRLEMATFVEVDPNCSYLISNFADMYFKEYSGKRVAIWGVTASIVRLLLESQVLRDLIVAVVDVRHEQFVNQEYCGYKVNSPMSLKEIRYDYVLTPTTLRRQEVLDSLKEMGISTEFIEFDPMML